ADLQAEVMRLTGGKGVDVLYDNIANPKVLPSAFHALGFDGRLVTAGAHGGPNVAIDFSHLYHKRITIKGRPGYRRSDVPKCFAADPPLRRGWANAYIPATSVIADDTKLRPRGRAERRGDLAMGAVPLMPKATAVWLVENTALSFDQVADFCKLHPLEV